MRKPFTGDAVDEVPYFSLFCKLHAFVFQARNLYRRSATAKFFRPSPKLSGDVPYLLSCFSIRYHATLPFMFNDRLP